MNTIRCIPLVPALLAGVLAAQKHPAPGDPGRAIEVFDVRGRRWAQRDVSFGPGFHRADAANGRVLPAGIWFARLREGAEVRVARMVIIR